ncbi:ATP-binding cassette sub-family B member 10, mitochondrial, partial [Egretta garzetta]|uniref:ATP-binding cassette sub-family B member 10, mitochondrial n=1 Tax=Egretta garzetta TaxID=188379 RepID=UPI00163D0311
PRAAAAPQPHLPGRVPGAHTWQRMVGCDLLEDNSTRGYSQYAYDGRDYIAFDMDTMTFTAADAAAQITKRKWEVDGTEAERQKHYLKDTCIEWLRKYVSYGRAVLERKERPVVRVSGKEAHGTLTLSCRAYGFYPRPIRVSWLKDGEVRDQETERGGIVPNSDGTYYTWASIEARPEEKDKYRCRVEHASLGEPGLFVWEPESNPFTIVVAVAAAILAVIAIIAGVALWKHKSGKKNKGYGVAPGEYRGQVQLQPLPSAGAISWLQFLATATISQSPVLPVLPLFNAPQRGRMAEAVSPLRCSRHHPPPPVLAARPWLPGRLLAPAPCPKRGGGGGGDTRVPTLSHPGPTSAVTEFTCDVTYAGMLSRTLGRLQRRVFAAVLRRDVTSLQVTGTGAVTARVTEDVKATHAAVAEALNLLLWYLARGVCLLVTMAWLSPHLAFVTFLSLPILLLLPRGIGKIQQGLARRGQEALAGATKVAVETFQAMATVRSFAHEAGVAERDPQRPRHVHPLGGRGPRPLAMTSLRCPQFSALALKLGLLCYGGQLVAAGTITTGDLVTFLIYQMQFTEAVEVMLRYYPNMTKAVGSSEKIFEFLDQEEQVAPTGTLAPDVLRGHLQLEDVWFSYPEHQEPVLKVGTGPGQGTWGHDRGGHSGEGLGTWQGDMDLGGKSTLVSLVLHLRSPAAGRVLLDGHPLPDYQHPYLRCQVPPPPLSHDVPSGARLSDLYAQGLSPGSEAPPPPPSSPEGLSSAPIAVATPPRALATLKQPVAAATFLRQPSPGPAGWL